MAAKPYIVERPAGCSPITNKVNTVVLWADDATTACDACEAYFDGDSDGLWAAATPVEVKVATTGMVGFRLHVVIIDPAVTSPAGVNVVLHDVTITADTNDTVDNMGADMAAALITDGVTGAAYNSGTNVLTIAETTDGLGDDQVVAEVLFPVTWAHPDTALTGAVTTIVDGGASSDALKCTLVVQAVPTIIGVYEKH